MRAARAAISIRRAVRTAGSAAARTTAATWTTSSSNAEGVAKVDVHASGVTLGGGAANDVAGKAVVVHAAPDDYTSQPAGNAGARVACGVINVTQ